MHDPFRLHHRPEPAPVDGDLPPPICLVDDDDLQPRQRPVWLRGLATLVVAFFVIATVLTTAASSGATSLLTGSWMVSPPDSER